MFEDLEPRVARGAPLVALTLHTVEVPRHAVPVVIGIRLSRESG